MAPRADIRGAIGQALAVFERTRAATLELAGCFDSRSVAEHPAVGRWSAGEVLDHLRKADMIFLSIAQRLIALQREGRRPVLRDGFADIDNGLRIVPLSWMRWLEGPLAVFHTATPAPLRRALGRSRLIRMRHPALAQPEHGIPLDTLTGGLHDSAAALRALIEANAGLDYDAMRYSQPLIGSGSLPATLRMLAVHEERHQAQLREILAFARSESRDNTG
jgi:hypothetical protein